MISAPYIAKASISSTPVILATMKSPRVNASRGSETDSLPGRVSIALPCSSRHTAQSPVARTSGPWPPCSVDQLLVATWIMVGIASTAQPMAKMILPGVASRRDTGAATCTRDAGLSNFTRAPSLVLAVHAKLSFNLPQVVCVSLRDGEGPGRIAVPMDS